jgi:hypothetical protein
MMTTPLCARVERDLAAAFAKNLRPWAYFSYRALCLLNHSLRTKSSATEWLVLESLNLNKISYDRSVGREIVLGDQFCDRSHGRQTWP